MTIDGELGLDLVPVAVGAVTLVAIVLAVSRRLGLGVERSIVWSAARATVQLLAVGFLFRFIFDADRATFLAWLWVGVMVVVSVGVLLQRAPRIPGLWLPAVLAIGVTAAVALGVMFGLGVLETEPVRIVVIAGITIGNSLPAGVSGVKQVVAAARERPGEIEGLLALGMSRRQVMEYLSPPAAALALVPQIERTRVVGLIALPGAMAGLLLAGADPVEAVVLQLLVMFLVLGAVSLSALILTLATAYGATSRTLRTADWVRVPEPAS